MAPDDIKALRQQLQCTAKELAGALGIEQATVMAWERADLFPTKAYVDRMNALRAKGPGAIVRKGNKTAAAKASPGGDAMRALADPRLWELVRKLSAHTKLREQVLQMAESYPDPATE